MFNDRLYISCFFLIFVSYFAPLKAQRREAELRAIMNEKIEKRRLLKESVNKIKHEWLHRVCAFFLIFHIDVLKQLIFLLQVTKLRSVIAADKSTSDEMKKKETYVGQCVENVVRFEDTDRLVITAHRF